MSNTECAKVFIEEQRKMQDRRLLNGSLTSIIITIHTENWHTSLNISQSLLNGMD